MPRSNRKSVDDVGKAIDELIRSYLVQNRVSGRGPATLLDVVAKAGINGNSYYKIVRGESNPLYLTVGNLLKAIGLTVCDLERYRQSVNRGGRPKSQQPEKPPTVETATTRLLALKRAKRESRKTSSDSAIRKQKKSPPDNLLKGAKVPTEAAKTIPNVEESRYVTLAGHSHMHKLGYSRQELLVLGQQLSERCRKDGIAIKKVSSESWGHVNGYPVDFLDRWRLDMARESLTRSAKSALTFDHNFVPSDRKPTPASD